MRACIHLIPTYIAQNSGAKKRSRLVPVIDSRHLSVVTFHFSILLLATVLEKNEGNESTVWTSSEDSRDAQASARIGPCSGKRT